MARGGVNKAVVQAARLAILARGENPSIDAVRIEMGNTGSKTTIHRYLKELDAGPERAEETSEPIDDELAGLVSRLAQRLKEQAQEPIDQAREQFDRQRKALETQLDEAREANTELHQQYEIQSLALTQESDALLETRSMLQTEQTRNAGLNQALSDFELRLKDKDEQIRSSKKNTCTPAMRLNTIAMPSRNSASRNSAVTKARYNKFRWNCVRPSKAPSSARMRSRSCTATTNAC